MPRNNQRKLGAPDFYEIMLAGPPCSSPSISLTSNLTYCQQAAEGDRVGWEATPAAPTVALPVASIAASRQRTEMESAERPCQWPHQQPLKQLRWRPGGCRARKFLWRALASGPVSCLDSSFTGRKLAVEGNEVTRKAFRQPSQRPHQRSRRLPADITGR